MTGLSVAPSGSLVGESFWPGKAYGSLTGDVSTPGKVRAAPTFNPIEAFAEAFSWATGTGGQFTDAVANLFKTSPTASAVRMVVVADVRPAARQIRPDSESVNAVRTAFGLSVTELAAVLGVERPTIYSWLKGQSAPTGARADRLLLVSGLADLWQKIGAGKVKLDLQEKVSEGMTLLRALHDPSHWKLEIEALMFALADTARNSAQSNRVLHAVKGAGISDRDASEFDLVTGRPLAIES